MASTVLASARLTLVYEEGSFGFGRVAPNAARDKVYDLAMALNSFQSEKPPQKILHVVTSKIVG